MLRSVPPNLSHGHRQTMSLSRYPTNRRVWMQRFWGATGHDSFANLVCANEGMLFGWLGRVRQRQDPRFFPTVIERMKAADFIKTSLAVERVEVMCVARRELARLEIAATQIYIAKCRWALAREKMKAQPAPIHARDSLGFSKERDKQKQNKIRIDLRLEFQVARKIFGGYFADTAFELKCSMQGMIK